MFTLEYIVYNEVGSKTLYLVKPGFLWFKTLWSDKESEAFCFSDRKEAVHFASEYNAVVKELVVDKSNNLHD